MTEAMLSAHANARVVVVEDNQPSAELVQALLARSGLPGVEAVADPRQFLERLPHLAPHLVLLDLNLADVGGEEILRALRDDPLTATIPVVIVSADAMPRQVQRLLSAGATAYLTKPIDVRQLLELVDRALAMAERAPTP